MALFFDVETAFEKLGSYGFYFRVSDVIYSDRRYARKYLKTLVQIIDDVPEVRQKFGPPENLYIHEGPGADPGYFAPLIG